MKFVYVLVGSTEGFYQEQTLVSVASLKFVSQSAKIALIVDDKMDKGNDKSLVVLRDLVDEYVVCDFEDSVPSIARSRTLKTTLRSIVDGDFLYVDSDTVWASPVDESDFTADVMGVLDAHCLLNESQSIEGVNQDFERTNCDPKVRKYVNGGVLFSRDSEKARKFFKIWHEKWLETSKSGYYIDMPSLNYAFKQLYGDDVPLLPGNYNSQISRSWKYFPKAKLVHFFTGWMKEKGDKPYVFQRKSFWEIVKKDGLNDYVVLMLKNPLEAFDGPVQLYDNVDYELKKTALYGLVRDMFERKMLGKKSRFDLVEKFVRKFSSVF
ncbi:MAG: putative nucleotide-diphospho-sugar transferase [Fibrobacter sp.]|nr:putative nucleotide-diphospho-sugar transferase [Fibrobacter sp.]